MTARLPGPPDRQPFEDIVDAEFVELDDEGQGNRQSQATAVPIVQRKRSIWGGVLVLITVGAVILLIALFVAGAPPDRPSVADPAAMLTEFSRQVTGIRSDAGFAMSDDAGRPGSECDFNSATQMLVFGGGGSTTVDDRIQHNAFRMAILEDETLIYGDFWFDDAEDIITISRSATVDQEGNPLQWLPDSVVSIQPQGDGYLDFRGTRFHVCRRPM